MRITLTKAPPKAPSGRPSSLIVGLTPEAWDVTKRLCAQTGRSARSIVSELLIRIEPIIAITDAPDDDAYPCEDCPRRSCYDMDEFEHGL